MLCDPSSELSWQDVSNDWLQHISVQNYIKLSLLRLIQITNKGFISDDSDINFKSPIKNVFIPHKTHFDPSSKSSHQESSFLCFLEHSSDNSNELRHIVISDSNMTLTFLPLSVWNATQCENL